MAKKLTCLRCSSQMQHIKRAKLQLGQTGWILGDLPNLIEGALEVDIVCCPTCAKLEFFRSDRYETHTFAFSTRVPADIPQRTCPVCGTQHDFDYPKCPLCGYDYYGSND